MSEAIKTEVIIVGAGPTCQRQTSVRSDQKGFLRADCPAKSYIINRYAVARFRADDLDIERK